MDDEDHTDIPLKMKLFKNELKKKQKNKIEEGYKAVEQLIQVSNEAIIKHDPEDDISADRLKNAAATKKLAIFDAFEILSRIEPEKEAIESLEKGPNRTDTKQGFAERRLK